MFCLELDQKIGGFESFLSYTELAYYIQNNLENFIVAGTWTSKKIHKSHTYRPFEHFSRYWVVSETKNLKLIKTNR